MEHKLTVSAIRAAIEKLKVIERPVEIWLLGRAATWDMWLDLWTRRN